MNPEPMWHHEQSTDGDHTTIVLTGELDLSSATELQNLLVDAVRTASIVTVDVSAVGFIDSTTITALVNAHNTAATTGCQFTLANPAARIRRVLQVTGVLSTFTAPGSAH
ncbi:STAS domain-containing protein [Actinoplanes sp. NEAU-A12]|uniref:Anti-sigma factor antagonist n=1 Tax=Actinoplanes sandaracinus TaxID=3045177 RepID=A0ABT6WXL3_9ACTN|nr:STAS domain-containing protein [Actinoplanes sandaracinus]MDI6104345.1 STAS domain-containing protein [Actinoplanes sandaracinus]